jgi:hypothetical protein
MMHKHNHRSTSSRRLNRLLRAPISLATAVLTIALVLLALQQTSSAHVPPPVPGSAFTTDQVLQKARSFATANGDASPVKVSCVHSSRQAAVRLTSGARLSQPQYDADKSVLLIDMQGTFTARMAHVPPSRALPTGNDIYLIINATTGQITDWGIGTTPVQLSRLGSPLTLTS